MGRQKKSLASMEDYKDKQLVTLRSDKPVLPAEQKFITEYLKTGNRQYAALKAELVDFHGKKVTKKTAGEVGKRTLAKPQVQAEIERIMDELRKESVATAQEVMAFFTDVMRGNVKDQFGLDVSVADRTKAAQELAKRTVDLDNAARKNSEPTINVKINWDRDEEDSDETE